MKKSIIKKFLEQSDSGSYIDVPHVNDKEYKTYMPINAEDQLLKIKNKQPILQKPKNADSKMVVPKKKLISKSKKILVDDIIVKEQEDQTSDQVQGDTQSQMNQNQAMIDPTMMGTGYTDPSIDGNYERNKPKTDEEVGRVFELKKIYKRLLIIDDFLSFNTEPILIKLKTRISQSIELFELLASNLMKFRDKLDDIIVLYYKFIEVVYLVLKKYYESKEKENNK